jgi:hypothetical protein
MRKARSEVKGFPAASVLRVYTHLMPNAAGRMRAAVDHVLATGGAHGPETAQAGQR